MLALLVGVLATWRLALLAGQERGPFAIGVRLRQLVGVHHHPDGSVAWEGGEVLLNPVTRSARVDAVLHEIAQGLTCLWCCSIWVGLAVAAALTPLIGLPYLLVALALSGGAIFLERVCK
ncbi:MAG: hypothetical protein IPK17_38525 [Chloroflexi bacterium]|uniref:DUF1360 domain-containing protein n=1 Tax=Candidatus Flexifilum breve TaxID=3140694 RepID=UPI003135224F|nr:hypothetical protein [Chloroflexota bacterium]